MTQVHDVSEGVSNVLISSAEEAVNPGTSSKMVIFEAPDDSASVPKTASKRRKSTFQMIKAKMKYVVTVS